MAGYAFAPYPAHGHVAPMLSVAAELVTTGHAVRMIAGEQFTPVLSDAGVVRVPLRREWEVWSPPSWGPRDLARLGKVRLRRAVAMRAFGRRCLLDWQQDPPEVVVVDPMAPVAARVAWRLRIPVVWLSTTHARSPRLSGSVLVNSLPELQPGRHRFGPRYRFVGPLLVPRHPPQCSTAGPVLLVSPGTVFARTAGFFRSVAEEFANTDWTVLMATSHLAPRDLGPLPDNVIARRWLPQRAVLPNATAFITHGGMNSVQEALSEAVPMVLAPRNAEQRATSQRLVELSLGVWLRGNARRTVEDLAANSRVRTALAETRARIRRRDVVQLAAETVVRAARRNGCSDPVTVRSRKPLGS